MRVTLRQLEVFDAIAQTGSVVKAGQQIGLSQSAASLSLRDLESGLGAELFERQGRRLVLNENGSRLRAQANALVRQARGLGDLLADDSVQGVIRIGATQTIGDFILPAICASFLRDHPGVKVEMTVDAPAAIMDQVEHLALDIGFIESACNRHMLEVQPWIRDRLCVFSAPDHRLAAREHVALEELEKENWCLQPLGYGARMYGVVALGEFLSSLNIGLLSNSVDAIKRAVAAGVGLGCLSRIAIADELAARQLREVSVKGVRMARSFAIIRSRGSYRSSTQAAFLQHVQNASGLNGA